MGHIPSPIIQEADDHFLLFGAGPYRPKWVYTRGALRDARSGTILYTIPDPATVVFLPQEYEVRVTSADDRNFRIYENEHGIYVGEGAVYTPLYEESGSVPPPILPRFEESPYGALLRALHHELLTNIAEAAKGGGPLPNIFVYDKPWYRDAAMVCMALARTGNLPLVTPWILSLTGVPFDQNNAGNSEPDNLGQLLYMISLTSCPHDHPMLPVVMKAIQQFEKKDADGNRYIEGLSDFMPRPVYQTKWLKFGLRSLGLSDPYTIPRVPDKYSALFWWDYKDNHVDDGWRFTEADRELYPYLAWAEDNFYNRPPVNIAISNYPLTYEAQASEADYTAAAEILPTDSQGRLCRPHTWHAAEWFLRLANSGDSLSR